MISIITGDIIQSRQAESHELWLNPLRSVLEKLARESGDRNIFRGDSFQLRVPAEEAFSAAFQIRAAMRSRGEVDARMAIAIGENGSDGPNRQVSESFGKTAITSGELLETLKDERQNLMFVSGDEHLDRELNLMLKLVLVILDAWSAASAEIALLMLEERELTQTEIGRRLDIAQSSVSERIKRGSIQEVLALESYYRWRLQQLI